jgi:hypothetical protein
MGWLAWSFGFKVLGVDNKRQNEGERGTKVDLFVFFVQV